MKYAIVENEFHSLAHIKEILENLRPDWELMFTADSVRGTVDKIKAEGLPDLLFLDIDLNDGNCFRLFDEITEPLPVIFTTAYDEFCLKAFKVHSIDYLLKPITTDSLLYAIRKYETLHAPARLDSQVISEVKGSIRNQPEGEAEQSKRILIPSKDGYRFVNIEDISWVMSDMKCVVIVDTDGVEHVTTFSSLNEIEDFLPKHAFFRVSRSVITSISAIDEVKKSFNYKLKIRLKAGATEETVEVGMTRKKEFLNWFGCNKS